MYGFLQVDRCMLSPPDRDAYIKKGTDLFCRSIFL